MKTELRRFTGYRIRFNEAKAQPYNWQRLMESAAPLAAMLDEARKEPHYLDDMFAGYSSLELLKMTLQNGEIYACLDEGQLKALAILRDITHERSAYMEAYAFPQFRGTRAIKRFVIDFLDYAFKDWEQGGLGLKKIKAEVNANNKTALKACYRMGFKYIGTSPCETLCQGVPEHTVLLELLNPRYFGFEVGDRLINEKLSQSPSDANVRSTGALRATGRSTKDSPAGLESNSSNEPGRGSGGDAPEVATAPRQPNGPSRKKSVRK